VCYSIDEERTFDTMTNRGVEKDERNPPLHADSWRHVSRMEQITDGESTIYYDPETAHVAAGDPAYEKRLPGSCAQCKAAALAEEASEDQT